MPSAFESFVGLLGPGHKLLSMLAAYCDESGKHKEASRCVVAGLRASVNTWKRFGRQWKSELTARGISAFHMVDCEHGKNEFSGLSIRARQDLQARFIGIMSEFTFVAVALSMPWELHPQAVAPIKGKQYRSNPYFLLFQAVIGQLVQHRHGLMPASRISFFFERQKGFEGTAHTVYNRMKNEKELSPRLGPLVYLDKADPEGIPLQAADILAYESFKYLSGEDRWQANQLLKPMMQKNLLTLKEWTPEAVEMLHELRSTRVSIEA